MFGYTCVVGNQYEREDNMPATLEQKNIKTKRSVAEFAQEWGVSKMTIYRLIQAGRLDATRIGNQWRIDANATLK